MLKEFKPAVAFLVIDVGILLLAVLTYKCCF